MLFTFKRDDEGFERAYVDGQRIMVLNGPGEWALAGAYEGIREEHLTDAIERADEVGFWAPLDAVGARFNRTIEGGVFKPFRVSEVNVDVPIPAQSSTVVSVVLEGDES